MFKKIVSQLSFSPALVGQLSFYAKRLRKEQTTRRLGLVFVALALVVQSLTVFQAPEPANAASNNDFVVGGLGLGSNRSLNNFLGPYDRGERHLKEIFDQVGISRAEIAATSFQQITVGSLKSYGFENRAGSTSIPIYNAAGAQTTTIFGRPLTIWGNSPSAKMWAYVGHSAKFGWFAILQSCGNLVTPEYPIPPTPGNVVTSKKAINTSQGNVDASKVAAKANDRITYTITATNRGGLGKSVTIKDDLSNVLTWSKLADTGGGTYTSANNTLSWPAVTLAGGQTITKSFTVQVLPSLTSSKTNCSMSNNVLGSIVTIPVACVTPANVTTSKTAVNVSQNNIDATKTTAKAGDKITYTITAKNTGGTAKGVSFVDDVSDILTWATIVDRGGAAFDTEKKTLSWGTLNVGAGKTVTKKFTVQIIADLVTTKTNCKIINKFADDTVVIPVGCTAPANIVTSKTAVNVSQSNVDATKTKAKANDKVTYTLTAKNTGGTAKDVTFSDDLSGVLIFSKLVDNGGGTFDANKQTLTWGALKVAPGATVTKTFTVQLNPSLENEKLDCKLTNAFYSTTTEVPVDCVLPPGQLVFDKEATNVSQGNIDATKTTAKAGDRITFVLTVNNTGGQAKSTAFVDTLSDVLEYATIIENGGGTFDPATKKLSWPSVSIPAGGKEVRTFTVGILKDIPATPTGKSDPSSYDCKIENTFENAHVIIPIECAPPKVVENVVSELPTTGPGENMLFAGILFSVVAFFYFRSRQLGTEVRLIRREVNGGTF